MNTVKFITPKTYMGQVGTDKDGTPIMEEFPHDNPGQEVEVPEDDAPEFDKMGWARAEEGGKKGKNK